MSTATTAWAVAASVGAVEALKDQGFCRWNYAFRLLHQKAKKNLGSYAQSKKSSPAAATATAAATTKKRQQEKSKQSEESLRTVMYLSSWAPN